MTSGSDAGRQHVFINISEGPNNAISAKNRQKIRERVRQYTLAQSRSRRLQNINPIEFEPLTVKRTASKASGSLATQKGKVYAVVSVVHQDDRHHSYNWSVRAAPPAVDYQQARLRYGFDLTWLSAYAFIQSTERPDAQELTVSSRRNELLEWLKFREASYLDLAPKYYADYPLIRDVTNCILLKVQQILTGSEVGAELVLKSYGNVLKAVRMSLSDRATMKSPETLCVVQMLQVYELLETSDPQHWISHTSGIIKLIEMRGPNMFNTELERHLLIAQLRNIFSFAFMNNSDCFLERPQWQKLTTTIAVEKFPVRQPYGVLLYQAIAKIPRLVRQTGEIFNAPDQRAMQDLSEQLRDVKIELSRWRAGFMTSQGVLLPGDLFGAGLQSIVMGCDSMVNRLIISLAPNIEDAYALEYDVQELAEQALALGVDQMFTLGIPVSRVAVNTKKEWLAAIEEKVRDLKSGSGLIRYEVFHKWIQLLRMEER